MKKPEGLRSERPASIPQRVIRTRAKIVTLAAGLASFAPAADAAAQSHTLVVLSHRRAHMEDIIAGLLKQFEDGKMTR
ncbi:MAG: hypothetical protein DMF94_00530, partial [Acidobacteria bacterium]